MPASLITRGASTLESLSRRSRLKIDIDLIGQNTGFVASYTTLDKIEGVVTVHADQDTNFHSVEITFEGTSRTSVERPATPGHPVNRPSAFHTFLKLRQPIDETSYPEPRVFKSRRLHKFPFTFVVPAQLLPQSCTHSICNQHLRHAHTQLPPSFGDPMLASDGQSLLDDLAPQMTQISYIIRVCVKRLSADGSKPKTLMAVAKKVRIIPASVEQPPLEIASNSDDYCLRKEKDVRKGLLRGKMGRLVMAASQPKPLQLRPPGSDSTDVSTAVTVHLRFDPEGDELPPRLGTLWSKLRASTFFATIPWTEFPSKSPALAWNTARGIYSETVPLSSLCVASAQWEHHTNPAAGRSRRGSSQSSSSAETMTGPSASYAGKTFYTASIIVPVSLPKGKAFVPTFHSCLVSRVYTLELAVSYHTPNTSVIAPSLSLKIPIQITSAHRDNADDLVDMADIAISQMQVEEEFFRPRSIAPPSAEYLERADFLLRVRNSYAESTTTTSSFDAGSVMQPPEYSVLPAPSLPQRALGPPDGGGESSISDFPADQTIRTRC
ncbi:hypothetical protein VTN77DRAFT_531 [Rasamsonia byssochlamydoides]|uniref:uncharacterized protein n=1 Tax=Rasamsonia byssochlamydoides TaxID=89139 RepID=UPI003742CF94